MKKKIGNPNPDSEDIGMEFGIEKYAMLIMKSIKRQMTEGTELPNQEKLERSKKLKLAKTLEYWKRTCGDERIFLIPQKNKKTTRNLIV